MGRLVLDLPYLNWADAKGKRYYYYRRNGKRAALPSPEHPKFKAEYDKIHAAFEARIRKATTAPNLILPGSFADLVEKFKKSADFTKKASTTRRDYGRYLDMMVEVWGDLLPEEVTRSALMDYRDNLAAKPREANYFMSVARILFYWAEDREIFEGKNPARKPKRLKEGPGHLAWKQEQINAYLDYHKGDDDRLLALALGLFAGQRRGDAIRRNKTHWNGTEIVAIAAKNGEPLWIKAMPPLKEILDRVMGSRFMMLQTKTGRAFTERSFSKWFAEGCKDAGVHGVTFHGLRVTAAEILCEFCTDIQLQAIFGWRSPDMAAHYRRNADRQRLATSGMKAWAERLRTGSDKPAE